MNALLSIVSGICVCLPVVMALVEFVQRAIKEKNFSALVKIAMEYMGKAELLFQDGATKKEWVLSMVEQSAATVNYDYTETAKERLSAMIDAMCSMAKTVNNGTESE